MAIDTLYLCKNLSASSQSARLLCPALERAVEILTGVYVGGYAGCSVELRKAAGRKWMLVSSVHKL